jgi:hypothetical protein
MRIINVLFPNKPWLFKPKIQDVEFGLMWFNKDRNPLFDHYQAHFTFKTTNSKIDAFFTSDKEGIDPKQRHFYWEIEKKYIDIIPLLIKPLENFYEGKCNQQVSIQNFKEEFTLFAVSISRYAYQQQEWSLSYTRANDPYTGITIKFKNWDVVDIIG